jgi:hypothetical protein
LEKNLEILGFWVYLVDLVNFVLVMRIFILYGIWGLVLGLIRKALGIFISINKLMQIWKDLSTGKFYTFDLSQGTSSPSNRFGNSPSKFVPYTSGYPRTLSPTPAHSDLAYSVQPSKFDGYSQFPRPRVSSSLNNPLTDSVSKVKVARDLHEFKEVAKPLKHLTLSAVYDKSITPPKIKVNKRYNESNIFDRVDELEKLRNSYNNLTKDIKTVDFLSKKLIQDKETFKPFRKKAKKIERRKMKGYFMNQFLTGGQLAEKERERRLIERI